MRKIHLTLSDATGKLLDDWVAEANKDFKEGSITHSNCAEHILARGKPDLALLRSAHIDPRRLLIMGARGDMDLKTLALRLNSLLDENVNLKRRAKRKPVNGTEVDE